ncbi:MAG TPA: hypothetical protein VGG69_09730 [Rhizomicrobium sp.]
MVDIVSDAGSGRTVRRVSAAFRLRSPSITTDVVSRAEAISAEFPQDDALVRVRLEIQEDRETGTIVYRLINVLSGAVIQEWRGEELAELRKFLQENRIQLLDKKV